MCYSCRIQCRSLTLAYASMVCGLVCMLSKLLGVSQGVGKIDWIESLYFTLALEHSIFVSL